MRNLALALDASWAVVQRDLRVLLSYRMRVFSLLASPVISVLLFYYVSRLVKVDSLGSSNGYFAYVIVGLASLGVLNAAVDQAASNLRQELAAGTFERMAVSAFGPISGCMAMTIFPVLLSIALGTATVVFAALACGLDVNWPTALAALPASVLVALAFAPIGILVVALMFIVRQSHSAVSSILVFFSLAAGVYFPVALLPGWIAWTSDVQPFTPAVGLMRNLLADAPAQGSVSEQVLKLAAFSAVLFPISVYALHRALRFSRRRGTITEY